MVTYENLFLYTSLIFAIIGICYQIFNNKKRLTALPNVWLVF